MSGALNSVFGGGGILGAALNVASMCFPPMAIANALTNMVTQAIGQAVGQAVQTLCQTAGMPKFIGQEITDMLKQVISELTKQSDPQCDKEVQDQCGGAFDDFANQFCKDIVNNAIEEKCAKGKGKGGGASWFEAVAKALGKALDAQAEKVEELSNKVEGIDSKIQGASGEGLKKAESDKASAMTDLQAASQKMSFMMSAADQVIKTLGEALSTMARKQ